MGQFVQHRREHFPAHGAMGTVGFLGCGATVGEAGQQLAIQIELGHKRRLTVSVSGHVIGPANVDASVQLLDETRWQRLHGFIEQGLAGLLLCRTQTVSLEA
ncbi:hypothetical protein D3C85_983670 [compost metagenome]